MARLFAVLFALVAALPALPAAPVPKHLFPKDPPLYYPTTKGTRWVYLEDKVEREYVVTKVEKNRTRDATIVSVAAVTEGKERPYRKVEVSRRGLFWLETTEEKAFDEPIQFFRCPVVAGDVVPYRCSGPGGIATMKGTMKVIAVEEIEVPAGTFTAVRVEDGYSHGDFKSRETHWFAPEVGLVKSDYGRRDIHVLKSFTPGTE